MTLLISNTDVQSLFAMSDCIEALEDGFKELAAGRAANSPRTDMMFPTRNPNTFYKFKCIQGGIMKLGVVGQRTQSDFDHFYEEGGIIKLADHRENYPSNVFLYSMETLELLAIVHDGELQRMRVAGMCAVAAKYLAKENARILGLYGAGFQAGSMIRAMCAVRPIKEVRVYSPTPERRIKFCQEMSEKQGIEVKSVDTPNQVPKGADIVACATNVVTPGGVCQGAWLEPGSHLTCIKYREFDAESYQRTSKIFHTNFTEDLQHFYSLYMPAGVKVPERSNRAEGSDQKFYRNYSRKMYGLEELLVGKVKGRTDDAEITMYMKGMGNGTEFTATAKKIYDLALARGIGKEIPGEWFKQVTHASWSR
ncbi:MAG: ornithine cyclodeaminase family protein [Deltaproteobacteria bacterium]|nr:ornithine cyclodeaminase family protein [Deltaproteobacteria bacterium]